MIQIREETPADRDAIHAINVAAFDGPGEADLVDALRGAGNVIVSLIALDDTEPVGHILFSRLGLHAPDRSIEGAALAPMAVMPGRQNQGIGSTLVRAGLEACAAQGIEAVVVLGHPDYYPRFGFSAELARNLRAPFSGGSLMALELTPGTLKSAPVTVRYAAAFGLER